ncbi:GGDEF domain-containing protein [Jiangella sp. DSM 45060]|uniref:GGDEF domain-containing protein n=1 Tax=Jiangella sp. DSM 45060 TaxID=1798224 RepID=UPI00087D2A7D|nr:GGDEF domain-containing protein [Jiangella sp. DSM 45060]SDT66188.1 diguanylate cyclase (GGDEF) domain-containing protein [Jiangella sp. DSM 45060]
MIRRTRSWFVGWALWQAPPPVRVLVVLACTVAAGTSIATAFPFPITGSDVARFSVLAVCAVVSVELTRHIERRRVYGHSSSVAYIDTKAVWSFAAVIVLPPVFATAMVILTYLLTWTRVQHERSGGLVYRWLFSGATVLCGTQAAVAVLALGMHDYPGAPATSGLAGLSDLGVITLAAVLRWAINVALVMVAIALSKPNIEVRELFSNFGEQMLEAGAMGLGLVAATVVVTNPFVMPGIVVAIVALHRGILVNQYQQASRTDAKTGLSTAGWWHDFADQALVRARDHGATLGLLIVDLDHFKRLNDTFGHPHGDRVLKAVAEELIAEIRNEDACGRWGGEEFVVVLPDVGDHRNLYNVAQRIRRRIESVAVEPPAHLADAGDPAFTASVGGAIYPSPGVGNLDELLLAADTALYAAKNGGRNTVRLSELDLPAAPVRPTLSPSAEPPSSAG